VRAALPAAAAAALVLFAVPAGAAKSPSYNLLQGQEGFRGTIARIDSAQAKRMTGVSWRRGCPVPLRDLRVLTLSHWGFDRNVRTGRLIVHEDVSRPVLGAFRELYAERFPIRRIVPVDAYDASDFRSIEADNTSAFNCRPVEGTNRWSQHAYGRAIDVNPVENPYVWSGGVSPWNGAPYVDRSNRRRGMIYHGDAVWWAFRNRSWEWGGDWTSVKDYQHFSLNGR
jgi:hypothetical protein